MLASLDDFLKIPYKVVIPTHGMFLWLEFSEHMIEENMSYIFEQSKVLFIPGSAFSPTTSCEKQAIRLGFTYPSHQEIIEGIRRLSSALNKLPSRVV